MNRPKWETRQIKFDSFNSENGLEQFRAILTILPAIQDPWLDAIRR